MARTADIPISQIVERLSYDPETGALTWIVAPSPRVRAGMPAGSKDRRGYIRVSVGKKTLFAHRIAFAIAYGRWPQGAIDHVNGLKADNRLENLREATSRMNMQNVWTPLSGNQSGCRGVYRQRGKWIARIRDNSGNRVYLGTFNSREDAREAYVTAKVRFQEGCAYVHDTLKRISKDD